MKKNSASTDAAPTNTSPVEDDTQRLDIWLYRTRLLKTRGLAGRIIKMGRVRMTRQNKSERIRKPHTKVRSGDVITFMRERHLIHVEVLSNPPRRGPALEAQTHYKSPDIDCAASNAL